MGRREEVGGKGAGGVECHLEGDLLPEWGNNCSGVSKQSSSSTTDNAFHRGQRDKGGRITMDTIYHLSLPGPCLVTLGSCVLVQKESHHVEIRENQLEVKRRKKARREKKGPGEDEKGT